jgi:PTS system ascorbate-specific IIB component
MRPIRRIVCCCGQGLGSSMMVEMNIQKALKKLEKAFAEQSDTFFIE